MSDTAPGPLVHRGAQLRKSNEPYRIQKVQIGTGFSVQTYEAIFSDPNLHVEITDEAKRLLRHFVSNKRQLKTLKTYSFAGGQLLLRNINYDNVTRAAKRQGYGPVDREVVLRSCLDDHSWLKRGQVWIPAITPIQELGVVSSDGESTGKRYIMTIERPKPQQQGQYVPDLRLDAVELFLGKTWTSNTIFTFAKQRNPITARRI